MGELIKEGKVRHWALSNETPYGVMCHVAAADAAGIPRPVALQQSYSLIHRQAEGGLAELCSPSTLGLGILPYSALAGGVLTGSVLVASPSFAHRPPSGRLLRVHPS
jgi:aryl-alcohol dehydrogenase-like predicted oxidoreductase